MENRSPNLHINIKIYFGINISSDLSHFFSLRVTQHKPNQPTFFLLSHFFDNMIITVSVTKHSIQTENDLQTSVECVRIMSI